jgi:hypothetical protein
MNEKREAQNSKPVAVPLARVNLKPLLTVKKA